MSVVKKMLGRVASVSSAVRARAGRVAFRARIAVKLRTLAINKRGLPLKRYARRGLGLRGKAEGVNFVAYIRAEMGLGEASRGMASAFEAASVPFNVINYEHNNPSRHTDMTWAHKERARSDYDISIVGINFDNLLDAYARLPARVFRNRHVVGNWYWELPEFPDEFLPAFSVVNEVWVATRFVQDAIAPKSPVPVVRMPPVVRLDAGFDEPRAHFHLPERRFLFLAMFDSYSVLERKNPLGVLRAYKLAFPDSNGGAGLVLKFNNPNPDQPLMQAVAEETRGRDDVYVIDRVITRREVNTLLAAADCFVSLHRSEGFGLGPAEAMYLGKPVVMTNWSGNTDFMTKDNSVGIDYELIELGTDYHLYKARQRWAEPDAEQAAHWMRRLYEEPDLAESIGRRGQETVRSEFSPERVGQLIARRLEYIRRTI